MTQPVRLSRKKAAKYPGMRWEALNEFCTSHDVSELTPVQRIAYLAYWYASDVQNAEHHQYFLHMADFDQVEVINALRAVEAMEQASVLDDAFRTIGIAADGAPQNTNRYLTGVEMADFTEFDDAFAKCAKPVFACLMDYLDKHEGEFIEWTP